MSRNVFLMFPLPLHHIGIAVTDLDAAIGEYKKNFSFQLDLRETLSAQGVELAFLKLGNTLIELLAPASSQSTLAKFLSQRGPGLHHVCYEVPDIVAELARLKALGLRLIDEKPRLGAHGSQIAFIHPASCGGVLTELCQSKKHPN